MAASRRPWCSGAEGRPAPWAGPGSPLLPGELLPGRPASPGQPASPGGASPGQARFSPPVTPRPQVPPVAIAGVSHPRSPPPRAGGDSPPARLATTAAGNKVGAGLCPDWCQPAPNIPRAERRLSGWSRLGGASVGEWEWGSGGGGGGMSFVAAERVQAIAHACDVPDLAPEAARALAPHVDVRLREIIQASPGRACDRNALPGPASRRPARAGGGQVPAPRQAGAADHRGRQRRSAPAQCRGWSCGPRLCSACQAGRRFAQPRSLLCSPSTALAGGTLRASNAPRASRTSSTSETRSCPSTRCPA